MGWPWIALGYVSYLAVVAHMRRDFARARLPLVIVAGLAWLAYAASATMAPTRVSVGPVLGVIVPSLVLVSGYWLSGLFFVRPDARIERWLGGVDDRILRRSGVLAGVRR